MSRYRAKPVEVEAVQWSGSNWHQMLAWVGSVPGALVHVDSGLALVVEQGVRRQEIDPGEWLVFSHDHFFGTSDPTFQRDYEPVEDS